MQRAVTAIYRSFATATLVREELERLAGIGHHNVTVIPDTDQGGATLGTGTAGDAFDRLDDLDLPESDTRTYQQALRNGDYVVSVSVGEDADLALIQEIMRRPEDAYDLDELDTQYSTAEYVPSRGLGASGSQMAADMGDGRMGFGGQQSGYASSGSMSQASGMGTTGSFGDQGLNEDGTVKVVEERLEVGKREVETGAVRVRSYVREEPVTAEVDLRATRVFVERRPVDRPVGAGDVSLGEQVIEAREHSERPVVSKEARVVEEIGLRQETETVRETIQDTVRKTEVEIEDERTGERSTLSGSTSTTGSGSTGSGSF